MFIETIVAFRRQYTLAKELDSLKKGTCFEFWRARTASQQLNFGGVEIRGKKTQKQPWAHYVGHVVTVKLNSRLFLISVTPKWRKLIQPFLGFCCTKEHSVESKNICINFLEYCLPKDITQNFLCFLVPNNDDMMFWWQVSSQLPKSCTSKENTYCKTRSTYIDKKVCENRKDLQSRVASKLIPSNILFVRKNPYTSDQSAINTW